MKVRRRELILGAGAALAASAAWAQHVAEPSLTPAAAMARLEAGNARFVANRATHRDADRARRTELARGQHPYAVILACADSRVAPELIFDEGLGNLFVVRVAGNVVDDVVLASIEYAVIHLGSTLVMVLGHQRCGAVTATVEALAGHGSEADKDTRIGALADLIAPAVKAVPPGTADKLDAAISLNAARAAAAVLTGSPHLRQMSASGQLKVVAARYGLDDGRVTFVHA